MPPTSPARYHLSGPQTTKNRKTRPRTQLRPPDVILGHPWKPGAPCGILPPMKTGRPSAASKSQLPILAALTETGSGMGKGYLLANPDALTENEALHILTSMVRDGTAGSLAPGFVKAILEIRASSGAAIGPPPPTNQDEIHARLLRIFVLTNQVTLDRAYADHLATRDLPSPDPGPEVPKEAAPPTEPPPTDPSDLE